MGVVLAEALQLSTMVDLDDIGMPPSAAQRVLAHFGKAQPGGAEPEPDTKVQDPHNYGLFSDKMALMTSNCGAMR